MYRLRNRPDRLAVGGREPSFASGPPGHADRLAARRAARSAPTPSAVPTTAGPGRSAGPHSRGAVIAIDAAHRHRARTICEAVATVAHPDADLRPDQGDLQPLPDGTGGFGWGNIHTCPPRSARAGRQLFEAHTPDRHGDLAVAALRLPRGAGEPLPALAALARPGGHLLRYAAGPRDGGGPLAARGRRLPASPAPLGSLPRSGFETLLRAPAAARSCAGRGPLAPAGAVPGSLGDRPRAPMSETPPTGPYARTDHSLTRPSQPLLTVCRVSPFAIARGEAL